MSSLSAEKLQALEQARRIAKMDLKLAKLTFTPLEFPSYSDLTSVLAIHKSKNRRRQQQQQVEVEVPEIPPPQLQRSIRKQAHHSINKSSTVVGKPIPAPAAKQRPNAKPAVKTLSTKQQPDEELVDIIRSSTAPLARKLSELLRSQQQQHQEFNQLRESLKQSRIAPTAVPTEDEHAATEQKENTRTPENIATPTIRRVKSETVMSGEQQRRRQYEKDKKQLETADRRLAKSFQRIMHEERRRAEIERQRQDRIRQLAVSQSLQLSTDEDERKRHLLRLLRQRFFGPPQSLNSVTFNGNDVDRLSEDSKQKLKQHHSKQQSSYIPLTLTAASSELQSKQQSLAFTASIDSTSKKQRPAINRTSTAASVSARRPRPVVCSSDRLALQEALNILDRIVGDERNVREKLERLAAIPRERWQSTVQVYTAGDDYNSRINIRQPAIASAEPCKIIVSQPSAIKKPQQQQQQHQPKFSISNYSLQQIVQGRERWMQFMRSQPLPFAMNATGMQLVAEPQEASDILDRMGDQLVDDLLDAACLDLSAALEEIVDTLFQAEFQPPNSTHQ